MMLNQPSRISELLLWKKILKSCLLTAMALITCLGLTVLWLGSTTSGLTMLVYSLRFLLPGTLKIEKITGTLFKDMVLENIDYRETQKTFTAKVVRFRGDWQPLLQQNIVLPYFQLEEVSVTSRFPGLETGINLELDTGRGKFVFFDEGRRVRLSLENVKGKYNGEPIYIGGEVSWEDGLLTFQRSDILWGDQKITVHPESEKSNTVRWVYQGKLPKTVASSNQATDIGNTIKIYGETLFVPFGCTLRHVQVFLDTRKTAVVEGALMLTDSSEALSLRTVQGNVQIEILNLLPLYHFLPMIARLQAHPKMTLNITGNVMKPVIAVQGEIGMASFSLPKQKINVKQFQLQASGLLNQDIKVKGSGYIHGHPFYLHGLWHPLTPGMPGEFYLAGQSLRLFNTENVHIVASPDLHLNYHDKTLTIEGSVEIMEGDIVLEKELTGAVVSNDVVYVDLDHHQESSPEALRLQPDIQFVLANDLHFKSRGLDANLGGRLKVTQRKDGIYTGEGRIVIRNGKYRLPNGIGNIYRGYLYYPAGTPLQDPVLDIRVLQKTQDKLNMEGDIGIYVQGSLQKPVYHLYSSEDLQQTTVLSKLGFGGTPFEGEGDQRKMLSQTAVLFGGGANPLFENIQSKLGLDKLSIQSGNTTQYFATPEKNDATLVVAKALSDRVYLQFMQGIFIPSNTLMLQYFITPCLFISGQTSTAGLGADISFSVEKD